jgi:catechol 2,3-dioxygenase-like lactoylglutathione lyase family enzyme
MGVDCGSLHVIHVRLPGCEQEDGPYGGPTIEIVGMDDVLDSPRPTPRSPGLMHTAFVVDDIRSTFARLLAAGGETLGEIAPIPSGGEFVYARDPEGNIVELQQERQPQAGA